MKTILIMGGDHAVTQRESPAEAPDRCRLTPMEGSVTTMTVLDDAAPAGLVPAATPEMAELLRSLSAEERLALLDDVAEQGHRDARPDHTRRAYAESWDGKWVPFCAAIDVEPTTAREGLFYLFVKWLERAELAPATVERHLAGVITSMRDRGVVLPTKGGPTHKAWAEVKAYERRLRQANTPRGRGKASALTPAHVRRICAAAPDNLFGLRDKTMLLLGLRFAARRSEVAALDATDIVLDPAGRGLEVTVRDSKTGAGRTVPVAYGNDPATCPVRAWLAWQAAAGITTGPAFCQIRERGCKPPLAAPAKRLTGQTVGTAITKLGKRAGIEIHATGHSVRAGFVTIALEAGVDVAEVCETTGHSLESGVVYGYKRSVDRWRNGAVGVQI
jgi:integrase